MSRLPVRVYTLDIKSCHWFRLMTWSVFSSRSAQVWFIPPYRRKYTVISAKSITLSKFEWEKKKRCRNGRNNWWPGRQPNQTLGSRCPEPETLWRAEQWKPSNNTSAHANVIRALPTTDSRVECLSRATSHKVFRLWELDEMPSTHAAHANHIYFAIHTSWLAWTEFRSTSRNWQLEQRPPRPSQAE